MKKINSTLVFDCIKLLCSVSLFVVTTVFIAWDKFISYNDFDAGAALTCSFALLSYAILTTIKNKSFRKKATLGFVSTHLLILSALALGAYSNSYDDETRNILIILLAMVILYFIIYWKNSRKDKQKANEDNEATHSVNNDSDRTDSKNDNKKQKMTQIIIAVFLFILGIILIYKGITML
jgi:SNF family Na+-dependent transporter